jgi:hypothetical protein
VHRLAEIALALLHLSVYLFFAGLVIIFHTINTKVAIAVEIPVGLYGLAYIMLSILPCLDFRCPYITPMSSILWYPFHIFSSFAAYCLFGLCQLYRCFFSTQSGPHIKHTQVSVTSICESLHQT